MVGWMGGLVYGRLKLADGSSERFAVEPADLEESLQRFMHGDDWFSVGEGRWARIVEIQVGEPVDPELREEMRSRLEASGLRSSGTVTRAARS
jgi:hypothetical protein